MREAWGRAFIYGGPVRNGGASEATILLIAGPGGCGKSTLIGALRAGRLTESPLPEAARFWPETSAKEMLRGDAPISARDGGKGHGPKGPGPEGLGPEGLGPKGLIVHYDTMRVMTLGFEDHHDDPAIRLIAAAEGTLLAVTVACPREALFAQYLARAVDRNDGLADAQGGRARLKRSLRHLRASAFGPPRVSLSRCKSTRSRSTAPTGNFFIATPAGRRRSTGSLPSAAMCIA